MSTAIALVNRYALGRNTTWLLLVMMCMTIIMMCMTIMRIYKWLKNLCNNEYLLWLIKSLGTCKSLPSQTANVCECSSFHLHAHAAQATILTVLNSPRRK
jgi:hypothetical protein